MAESMKNTYPSMLKTIIRTSDWTQEQLAEKLGVSFATINSWINGKSIPREAMKGRIQRLYLAQNPSDDVICEKGIGLDDISDSCDAGSHSYDMCRCDPRVAFPSSSKTGVYVTILNADRLYVGATVTLVKTEDNVHDDEAIEVEFDGYDIECVDEYCGGNEYGDGDDGDGDGDGDGDEIATCEDMGRSRDILFSRRMYVANSVSTVARGTYSAGRIYDKFDFEVLARVDFIVKGVAIAKVDLELNLGKVLR